MPVFIQDTGASVWYHFTCSECGVRRTYKALRGRKFKDRPKSYRTTMRRQGWKRIYESLRRRDLCPDCVKGLENEKV